MGERKRLLLVYHSLSGSTSAMADAVERGARSDEVHEVEFRRERAMEADVEALLWAEALILGTPENFGYMSGGLKDFFDRTFYPAQGKVEGLPIALFIKGGNDGTGALGAIRRIVRGYPFREVQEPVLCAGDIDADTLARCEALGMSMAAGLELGLF